MPTAFFTQLISGSSVATTIFRRRFFESEDSIGCMVFIPVGTTLAIPGAPGRTDSLTVKLQKSARGTSQIISKKKAIVAGSGSTR